MPVDDWALPDDWTAYDEAARDTWPPPSWDEDGWVIPGRRYLVLDWIDDTGYGGAPHVALVATREFLDRDWWDLDGNDRRLADDRPKGADGCRWWRLIPDDLPGRRDVC